MNGNEYTVKYAGEDGNLILIDNQGDELSVKLHDDGNVTLLSEEAMDRPEGDWKLQGNETNAVYNPISESDMISNGFSQTTLDKATSWDVTYMEDRKIFNNQTQEWESHGDRTTIFDIDGWLMGNQTEPKWLQEGWMTVGTIRESLHRTKVTFDTFNRNRSFSILRGSLDDVNLPEGLRRTSDVQFTVPNSLSKKHLFEMLFNPCFSITFETTLNQSHNREWDKSENNKKYTVYYRTLRETMTQKEWDRISRNPDWIVVFGDDIQTKQNLSAGTNRWNTNQVKSCITNYLSAIQNTDWNESTSGYYKQGQARRNNTLHYFLTEFERGQSYKALKNLNPTFNSIFYKNGANKKEILNSKW